MTVFSGYRINDDLITGGVDAFLPVPGRSSNLLGARVRPALVYSAFEAGQQGGGPVNRSAQPLAIRELHFGGQRQFSFFDDFYNRIYMIPTSYDFGAIASATSKQVSVWNAYLTPKLMASLSVSGGEGLVIAGPSAPYQFQPLANRFFTITATPDGPPLLNATVAFTFDTPETAVLTLTGIRAKLWPFSPNWDDSYKVTRSFKTDIITSRAGKEQRRALRRTPRKTIEFGLALTGQKLTSFQRLIASWQHRSLFMPDYSRFVESTAPMAADSATMQLAAIPTWLSAGDTVIIGWGARLDLRTVASLGSGYVNFQGVGDQDWPVGTRLYAAYSGNLASQIQADRPHSNASTVKISFDVVPGSERADVGTPFATFNGREMLIKTPNWGQAISLTHGHDSETVDFGYGKVARFTPIEFGNQVKSLTFVGKTYDEARALEQFFNRMSGQQGEFYMPTWDNDLPPKFLAPAGVNSLRIDGTEVYDAFVNDTVFRAIAVFMKDGSTQFRKVQTIYKVTDAYGTDSVVQCSTNFTIDIDPAKVMKVCWMPTWRFASDNMTTEWLTDAVAQFKWTVRTLEDLAGT